MASRKKNGKGKEPEAEEKKDARAYYDLKTQAVEDLVNADVSNSPKVSEEELAKYRSKKGIHLPDWLKILLAKTWFAGAVCFFCLWGIGNYTSSLLDQLVVSAIALGIVTDLLTNNLIRFMAVKEGDNDKWMMFPKKRYMTFIWNILYSAVIMFLVYTAYNMVNYAAMWISGNTEKIFLGVEPVFFGLFCMGADVMLVAMKNTMIRIVKDAGSRAKASGHGG